MYFLKANNSKTIRWVKWERSPKGGIKEGFTEEANTRIQLRAKNEFTRQTKVGKGRWKEDVPSTDMKV